MIKLRQNSKFMTSQTNYLNTHMTYCKLGNEIKTMKFGQSIEYSTRNNFLEKSYTCGGGEISPRPFLLKLSRSMHPV